MYGKVDIRMLFYGMEGWKKYSIIALKILGQSAFEYINKACAAVALVLYRAANITQPGVAA